MTQTLWQEPGNEDFQDYVPWWREHPLMVVLLLMGVVAIATILWYMWSNLSAVEEDVDEGAVPVFYSDHQSMKRAPDAPGGAQMPHQDNTVYQRLNASKAQVSGTEGAQIAGAPEAPLPGAERTLPLAPASFTQTQVSTSPQTDDRPVAEVHPTTPVAQPVDVVVRGNDQVEIQSTPSGGEKVVVENLKPNPTPALEAQPKWAPVTTGSSEWRIQLASLNSKSRAEKEWARLKNEYQDLLGGISLTISEANLAGKGMVYRVQAGPLVNKKQAHTLCKHLQKRGGACFAVPPG